MSKLTNYITTYRIAIILNLLAYSLTTYLYGYRLTICMFLLIWANNAERTYRGKKIIVCQ